MYPMLSPERIKNAQELASQIPHQHRYPEILESTIETITRQIKRAVDRHSRNHLEEQLEIAKVKLQYVLDNLAQDEEQTAEESERLGGERVHQEEEDDAELQLRGSDDVHTETPSDSETDV